MFQTAYHHGIMHWKKCEGGKSRRNADHIQIAEYRASCVQEQWASIYENGCYRFNQSKQDITGISAVGSKWKRETSKPLPCNCLS